MATIGDTVGIFEEGSVQDHISYTIIHASPSMYVVTRAYNHSARMLA